MEGRVLMKSSANCKYPLVYVLLQKHRDAYRVDQHHEDTGPKQPVTGRGSSCVSGSILEGETLVRDQRELVGDGLTESKAVLND